MRAPRRQPRGLAAAAAAAATLLLLGMHPSAAPRLACAVQRRVAVCYSQVDERLAQVTLTGLQVHVLTAFGPDVSGTG